MTKKEEAYEFTLDMRAGRIREGQCFRSDGKVNINGTEIGYYTEAQDYVFLDAAGEEEASVFLISQFKTDTSSERPVLFVMNGGPGMSMADMYVTMYGPWALETGEVDECRLTAPFTLLDNQDWLIDVCDIVLIDPVGAGYGRLLKEQAAHKYYSIEGDAYALAKIIKYWITKYGRWNSPRYFNGVSYGGIRCATVIQFLMGGALQASRQIDGITFNGVISMADCMTIDFVNMVMDVEDNPTQVTILPTCAAVNHYHNPDGKPELDLFINEAQKWGQEEMKPFLQSLGEKSSDEKKAMADKLAYYIGIPGDQLLGMDFQYEAYAFTNMLLAGQGKAAAYYDGRFTMQAGGISTPTFDPIYDDAYTNRFWPATTAAAMEVYAKQLGIRFDDGREFLTCNFLANSAWDYHTTNGVKILDIHIGNMRHNREMRQLMVAGKYDFCHPLQNARYTCARLVENGFADRVTYLEMETGHEAYYTAGGRKALAKAMRAFIGGE